MTQPGAETHRFTSDLEPSACQRVGRRKSPGGRPLADGIPSGFSVDIDGQAEPCAEVHHRHDRFFPSAP